MPDLVTNVHADNGHTLVAALFAQWDQQGIRACIWKSADRWQEGIDGTTDFDILVPAQDVDRARQVLMDEGWIPVDAEAWRTFPGLFDYIAFVSGACLHVHLHAAITSGEKLTKTLRPPLTDLYLRHLQHGYPPTITAELEFVLLVVRTVLKISWLDIAGALRRRSAAAVYRNYTRELDQVRQRCRRDRIQSLLEEPELQSLPGHLVLQAHDDLASLRMAQRKALRRAIATWRIRPTAGTGPLRFVLRRAGRFGKTLPFQGISIGICGPDGSGKTTTTEALRKVLSRQLRVEKYYLGGNLKQPGKLRGTVMKGILVPYLALRKACRLLRWNGWVAGLERWYANTDRRLTRGEKLRRVQAAEQAARTGSVVLFERYPLFHPYGDDMQPTLHPNGPRCPDILVLLDVAEATAIERRPDDDPETLRNKIQAFRQFAVQPSNSKQLLVFNESVSLQERVGATLDAVMAVLTERARRTPRR